VNATNSAWQRITKSKLRLRDTIFESDNAPGLLYEGALDGKSVVVKYYQRKRGVRDQTEKVRIDPLIIPYLTADIS
jgi:hypothetical protein